MRCNAVLPGFIQTPMTEAVPEKVLEKARFFTQTSICYGSAIGLRAHLLISTELYTVNGYM